MSETSKAVALPTAAILCENLLDVYGEPSHHDGVVQQARFEATDLDGCEYSVLLTQKNIGLVAVCSMRVHESLNGTHESIYTMQSGEPVSEKLKIAGDGTYGPYEWPASTGSTLLYGCYDNQRF